jgi:protein-tyrosine kinase
VRALRGQLMLRWLSERRRALAVVAPRSAEGAAVIACNLAISFTQMGERTLLIDANMRAPEVHALFGIEQSLGLSALLAGRSQFEQVVSPVAPFDQLSVITAGVLPPNPHELLCAIRFSYLMETAPAAFDVVIVSVPALLDYPDGQMIASKTSGTLMVTRRHLTHLSDVHSARLLLEPTGSELVGVVINN